jgi:gamma-glutamyl-gamma-aminobutyrate hydrolase PuuD
MKNTKRQQPIIGILPDYNNGEENSYSTKSFYAQNCNLVDSIVKANGIPILITYQSKNIDDYLNSIDGLLISGGDFDIDPVFYNETFIHSKTKLNLRFRKIIKYFKKILLQFMKNKQNYQLIQKIKKLLFLNK